MNQYKNTVTDQLHFMPTDRKSDELEQVGCNYTTNRRHYEEMSITPVAIEMRQSLLTGSLTNNSMKVNTVEVEDFDAGFSSSRGYENDCLEISFD